MSDLHDRGHGSSFSGRSSNSSDRSSNSSGRSTSVRSASSHDSSSHDSSSHGVRWSHRRQEILSQVVTYIRQNGVAELSLREMAKTLNLSAPALLYHFKTKERLLERALELMQQEDLQVLEEAFKQSQKLSEALESLWRHQSGPEQRNSLQAVREIESVVAKCPERFPKFHGQMQRPWLSTFISALARAGCPDDMQLSMATILVASYRGLLNDLLQTGENKRVSAALYLICNGLRDFEHAWSEIPELRRQVDGGADWKIDR